MTLDVIAGERGRRRRVAAARLPGRQVLPRLHGGRARGAASAGEHAPSQRRRVRADRRPRRGRARGREVPAADRPLGSRRRCTSPRTAGRASTDELASRDPKALRRLGRELSLALGAIVLTLGVEEGAVVRYILWDHGGVADEYASVPEHFGPLPPGDVVALGGQPDRCAAADGRRPGTNPCCCPVGRLDRASCRLPASLPRRWPTPSG